MLFQPLRWFVWLLGRLTLSLRYRTTVVGKREAVAKPGPYLVLPNHVGYADPPNILVNLWQVFRFRPVLNEVNFQNPVLGPFAWLLRSIYLPDMEKTSADAHKRALEGVRRIIDALKGGDNVVVWPSGRLTRDGLERMGGARGVSDILAACPEATVVLVRTRGLWGSRFTWADGPLPNIVPMIFKAGLTVLSNLLLFTPRRRLTMTLKAFTAAERPEPTRDAVNKWLEEWFNADLGKSGDLTPPAPLPSQGRGEKESPPSLGGKGAGGLGSSANPWPGETPVFVPYHFLFGPRTHEYPPPHREAELDLSKVKPETKRAVGEIVADKLKRPLTDAENRADMSFLELGIDSLDGMEISLNVEQRFGFSGDAVPSSIGHLWALAEGLAQTGPAKPPPPEWFIPPSDNDPVEVLGETVPEAFVRRCLKHPKDTAAADDLAGTLSYERLFLGGRLMAERFRKYPEPNVGLMLPASVAADLALVALHLAGKLPVVLNWTTGPTNLEHAVKLMEVTRVITSKAFIDRTHLEVPGAEFVFLEDVRKTIGKVEGLTKLLHARLFPAWARGAALKSAITDPQRPAVVLFTSGSEKAPKAVPLTHANVIANVRGFVPALGLNRRDSVLGFLPLFHSFGHTVTGLFPLMAGVKILHHPDPTDAGGLARKIAAYKPTLTAGTPTFLAYILDKAKPGDLDSLKYIAVGAEKCPDAVFEKVRQLAPNAKLLEGYGITECAPIVSFNPPERPKLGTIGKPLPGTDVRVVELDTNRPLPQGEMGMLEVSGPGVFPGYIGYDGPSPFANGDGKKWYVTGDLAALDPDGYIVFHGRLKRFLKAGGEMISLPALEEPFAKLYPPTEEGPRVAVEGVETPGGRKVVLFTNTDLSVRDANAVLQKEGFRGVMRLDEVRKVDKIPVLGTGKTDYKVLKAQLS